MPTRTPVNLADLAKAFAELQPDDATRRRIAALLGFEAAVPAQPVKPGSASEPSRRVQPVSTTRPVVGPSPFDAFGDERREPEPTRGRPTTGSTLSFDLSDPVQGTPPGSAEVKPEWWERLTVLDKPVDPARIPPPAPLLLPIWSRTTYMRALSTVVREGRLDIPRLVDLVARLEVPAELPRLPWSTMRRGVQLLVDYGDAMMPFRDDQQRLVREIQELAGTSAFFEVYRFWGTPTRRSRVQIVRPTIPGQEPLLDPASYHLPPPGTPILALTDLGIGALAAGQAYIPPQEWQAFVRSAESAGCPLTAFVPYHLDRCPESLRREIRIIHWHHARGASGVGPTALRGGSSEVQPLLEILRQRNPQAVALAHLASLASRVELSLLRELRLNLLADADGGAEADLWFSPLASVRSETALLLQPMVAEALRRSLFQAEPDLFEKAWHTVQAFRARTGAFEGTRLEEEINYWLAKGGDQAQTKVQDLLRRAVKTVYELGTTDEGGLALWSVELLDTVPQEARDSEAGRDLGTVAGFRLDPSYVPPSALPDDISGRQWLIPVEAASLPSVSVWVGREPDGLVLADREDLISGAKELEPVPATTPVVVWLSWNDGQGREKVVITPGEKVGPIPTGDHPVTIETFAGTSWKLTPSTVAAERLSPGSIFGDRYEVFEELEPGRLTDRYHARDVSSGEEVIVAVGRDLPDSAEFPKRFEQEARAFARLEHPGLVRVLDHGVRAGRPYLVTEQIGDEETLQDRLVRGRLPLDEALPILTQVASALDYLHAQDPPMLYLHLEPSHVLLEGDGETLRAVLSDGVTARAWQASGDGRVAAPGYVSPEQVGGAPPSPQSDVYGLGLLAYEMLAGRPPFSGDVATLLVSHAELSPRPLHELVPELRDNVSAAVLKALAKVPDERYPSAGAFVEALQEAAEEEQVPGAEEPFSVEPRVLVLNFAPIIRSEQGRTLYEVLGWNDPRKLAEEYITDLAECSGGYLRYQIAEWRDLDAWPVKADGFRYDENSFLRAWRSRAGFHQPDSVDYEALLDEYEILKEVDSGRIDEVWLFSFPYGGFYESSMIGPSAIWTNAPPIERRDVSRRFVIMAFSYERGVGPMLESFGHRVESLLKYEWRDVSGKDNLWERFSLYDKIAPGQAGCGTMHYAPNSAADYDWGNTRKVPSTCDDWLDFPNLQGTVREVDCSEWGDGDMRAHHQWWLRHLPCAAGQTDAKLNNWWAYAIGDSAVEATQAEDAPTPVLDELLLELARNAPSRGLGLLRRGREEDKAIRRRRLMALLGETGDTKAVSVLLDHLREDPDGIVRRVAAQALGELGDAQAVEPLIAALEDEEGDVRAEAARALGSLGDVRVVEPLIAALEDADGDVRAEAAKALGSLGDERAVEPLRQAAADRAPEVQVAAADALRQLQPEPGPGTIFAGKYEIAEQRESGGLTARYQARDVSSGQQVRLILVPEPPDDAGFSERFEREAATFARLDHPGLVRILDYGVEAGRPYLVKERVGDERTLHDLLTERRSLSLEQSLPILAQVASALDYLHAQDPPIMHLHLKPSHVLLEGEGDSTRAVLDDSVTTRAWQAVSDKTIIGAPAYLSPEQADGAPVSPQTDVYELGLLAYEMLAGRPPFTGDAAALLKAHAQEPPRPPQEFVRALSDNANAAILRALAKDPDDRFASAGAFVAALQVQEPQPAFLMYRDFVLSASEVQQDAGGERISVAVHESPGGERLPTLDVAPIPPGLWSQLRRLERRELDLEEMIELGQELAQLLLPQMARRLLDRSRARLRTWERLRIRLEIDDQRLADIPWEYLYVPGPDAPTERSGPAGFLALDPRVSMSRSEPRTDMPSLEPVGVGPLRLAVLLASPNSLPPLDLELERKVIVSALSNVPEIEVQFFPGGTVGELRDAITTQPHVLHFVGHGQFSPTTGYDQGDVYFEEALALVGQDGGVDLFPAEKLAHSLVNSGIRLVVLGACETGRQDGFNVWTGVAPALIREGIPAVVGMQYSMRDVNAIAFSRQFYRALADGRTIDEAVSQGRMAISTQGKPDDRDWGVPVLYLRTPGAVLFPRAAPSDLEPEM